MMLLLPNTQDAEALLFPFSPSVCFSLSVLGPGHFLGPCTCLSPYHNNPHLYSTPATCLPCPAFPRSSATPLAIGAVANDWLPGDRSGRLP
jgi:hypothetical protein